MKRLISIFVFFTMFSPSYGAVDFSGLNAAATRINCGTVGDLVMRDDQPITISFWMYIRTLGGGSACRIVDRGNPAIRLTATNALLVAMTAGTRNTANSVYNFNQWAHIAMTWDGSTTAANIHFYINGIEPTYLTTTDGSANADNSAAPLVIGALNNGTRGTDGLLDDVAFYDRILTANEIKTLAGSRVRNRITTGRIVYLPLDQGTVETSSGTFKDSGPNQFTCVHAVAATWKGTQWLMYP